MASVSSIHLPGRVHRYFSEPPLFFPWTEASKVAKEASKVVGYALLEMPLSVGSKLELLWALSLSAYYVDYRV